MQETGTVDHTAPERFSDPPTDRALQTEHLSSKRPAHEVCPPPTDKPQREGKVSFEILQTGCLWRKRLLFYYFFKGLGRALIVLWRGEKFGFSGNQPEPSLTVTKILCKWKYYCRQISTSSSLPPQGPTLASGPSVPSILVRCELGRHWWSGPNASRSPGGIFPACRSQLLSPYCDCRLALGRCPCLNLLCNLQERAWSLGLGKCWQFPIICQGVNLEHSNMLG